jgi:hypothetical protein
VAFVVLVNMASYFPEIVRNSLLDLLLGVKGGKNWHQVFQKQLLKDTEKARADKKAKAQKRHKNTKPSLPLTSYIGTYRDPGYGTATVREESGKLHLAWEAFDAPLKHWHHDTFITDTEQPGFASLDIVFTFKADGTVATLSLFEQSLVKN